MNNTERSEWLLMHYRGFQCRLALLEATVEHYRADDLPGTLSDQMIEDMSLSALLPDDVPSVRGTGSKTEYVALHYEERLRAQKQEELSRILIEIQKLRYDIRICDTLLASLSHEEKWLIENKYILHKTYDKMLTELPSSMAPLSKSALWYRCKQIVRKLNEMLGVQD